MEGANPSPLSPDALSVLVRAREHPVACRAVPAHIRAKLVSEGWAVVNDVVIQRHGGKEPALAITEKGKARIAFDEP